MENFSEAPRIYNLFPRLVGQVSNWEPHLKRAHSMGFTWIYVNPLSYPGFSGSLYSIKDFFRMNPIFAINEQDQQTWGSLKEFITRCHSLGMKFMIDIVINHMAIDSVDDHPGWFAQKFALIENATGNIIRFFKNNEDPVINEYPPSEYRLEKRIANPFAIDPADSRKITIWGDLAEIDYDSSKRIEIMAYWKRLFDFFLNLGIDGFRCDAAYQVDNNIWKELITHVKTQSPNSLFMAETLGCTQKECQITVKAGFDYILSSSKWWDFTKPWCIEQYNEYRHFAPSISFPETHDTLRLAFESRNREDVQKVRYLFAAFFSAGIMMPLGYEYGFQKKMDVVDMTPKDWEEPKMDISHFIFDINHLKSHYRCLNEDGAMKHFDYSDLSILILRKSSVANNQHMLFIYNKDWNNYHHIYIPDLKIYLDLGKEIYQIDSSGKQIILNEQILNRNLFPNEYMLFFQEK